MNSLGERIAHYRKRNDLTQEQLAEKCSVTAQAVSKWENDLTAPDIQLIPALAKIFGVTCDELLGVTQSTVAVAPEKFDVNRAILKIKAYEKEKSKLSLNLPLSVAEIVIKSGALKIEGGNSEMLKKIDFAQIISMVQVGVIGKIIEAQSDDGGFIEIWVE